MLNKIVGLCALGFVVASGAYVYLTKKEAVTYPEISSRYVVERGDIANSVLVFGKAGSDDIYDLSFDVSGKLVEYALEEGQSITQGDVIARLDTSSLLSDIAQSRSNLAIERSRLADLRSPISPQAQAQEEASIEKQKLVVEGNALALDSAIRSALDDYDDQVESVLDPLYLYPREQDRIVLRLREVDNLSEQSRQAWTNARTLMETSYEVLRVMDLLEEKYRLFEELVNYAVETSEEMQAVLTLEQTIAAEQLEDRLAMFDETLIDIFDSLNAAYTTHQTSIQELEVLEKKLVTGLAGADTTAIALQESVIRSKISDIQALETDLEKYELRSPISGVVFDAPVLNYQTVSPGLVVASLIEDKPLVVIANIAESDIGYVGVGNPIEVTFDALDGVSLTGVVEEINTRENRNENVPTYRTIFELDASSDLERVRSGMTANVTVTSSPRSGVLYVPINYLEVNAQGDSFLTLVDEVGNTREVIVTRGIKTSTGYVEIISGLEGGETVVITK